MFDNDLHEQLFALFIAESNSSTYQEFGCDNSVNEMQFLIETIRKEYQLLWLDRGYIVKEIANE
jgi:hypothetical protein